MKICPFCYASKEQETKSKEIPLVHQEWCRSFSQIFNNEPNQDFVTVVANKFGDILATKVSPLYEGSIPLQQAIPVGEKPSVIFKGFTKPPDGSVLLVSGENSRHGPLYGPSWVYDTFPLIRDSTIIGSAAVIIYIDENGVIYYIVVKPYGREYLMSAAGAADVKSVDEKTETENVHRDTATREALEETGCRVYIDTELAEWTNPRFYGGLKWSAKTRAFLTFTKNLPYKLSGDDITIVPTSNIDGVDTKEIEHIVVFRADSLNKVIEEGIVIDGKTVKLEKHHGEIHRLARGENTSPRNCSHLDTFVRLIPSSS